MLRGLGSGRSEVAVLVILTRDRLECMGLRGGAIADAVGGLGPVSGQSLPQNLE